jgi:hypothetical protein
MGLIIKFSSLLVIQCRCVKNIAVNLVKTNNSALTLRHRDSPRQRVVVTTLPDIKADPIRRCLLATSTTLHISVGGCCHMV